MYSKFTVSITDLTGSSHYEMHKNVKKGLFVLMVAIFISIPAAVLAIHQLNQSIRRLENKNNSMINAITAKYSLVGKEYKAIGPDANSKIKDLFKNLEIIETALKTEAPTELNLVERMERAGRFVVLREKVYQEIANKIENIEQMIGLKSLKYLNPMQRVDLAGRTVYRRAVMLNSIPNGCPVEFKGISSQYGWRIHPILKVKEYHDGVDLLAAINTSVKATADGVVEYAGRHPSSGFGILIIIRHNYAFRSSYGHLNKLNVRTGDFVTKGQVIAFTGNSGLTDGPHLHYEIRFIERSLNPEPFMKWNMDNYKLVFKEVEKVKWESLKNLIDHRLTLSTRPSLHLAQK